MVSFKSTVAMGLVAASSALAVPAARGLAFAGPALQLPATIGQGAGSRHRGAAPARAAPGQGLEQVGALGVRAARPGRVPLMRGAHARLCALTRCVLWRAFATCCACADGR
jgi:hypothetical protein